MKKADGRAFEDRIAKRTGGKKVPLSGAGIQKEDVIDGKWLVQAKSTNKKSYTLKFLDLQTLASNAMLTGKYPRMEIEDSQGDVYIILRLKEYENLLEQASI